MRRPALEMREPQLIVTSSVEVMEARVERLERSGASIRRGWKTEAMGDGREVFNVGRVETQRDATAALLAALGGAGVVAVLPSDAALSASFFEDLRRLGRVELADEPAPSRLERLDEDQRGLLDLLGKGFSVSAAARELYISRRTADRRLAAARETLDVRSNAEAVVLATPPQGGPGNAVLVGRQDKLALMRGHIECDRSVALVGTAGVGKTALLRETVRTSEREVFAGGGLASLAWLSYLPLARAFRESLPYGDEATVAAFVRERLDGGLLVLDDLHWSDPDTLVLLAPLAASGVTLVAAVRSGDRGTRAACRALREAGVELVDLEELRVEDAKRLIRWDHPDLDDRSLVRILQAAGGNPFLLRELAASPEPSPTLRLTLRARLDRCSAVAQRSMSLLALLGRAATRDLIGEAVDELVEAGLVQELEEGYEPRHALLAESAIEQLGESKRRELHARLARALADEAESARHHAAAGERDEAMRKALRAAERTERPGERASHLGLAASCASGQDADELRLEAAAALLDAGRFEEAGALAAAVESANVETQARADLLRGKAHWARGERGDAVRELDAGIALVDGRGVSVEARLRLERLRDDLHFGGSDVVEKAQLAWDVAHAAGVELARADFTLGVALCWYARSDSCLPVLERAVEAADPEADPDLWFTALQTLCGGLQVFGRAERLEGLEADAVMRAREMGLRRWELHFTWMRGQNAYLQGEYVNAIKWLSASLADPSMAHPDRDQVAADLATSLADTGRPVEALGVLRQARGTTATPWGRLVLLLAESETAWLAGQPLRALAAAEAALAEEVIDAMRPQVDAARDWAFLDLRRPPGPPSHVEPLPFYAGFVLDSQAIAAIESSPNSAERFFLDAAEAYRSNILRNELRSLWAAADIAVRQGAVGRGRRRLFELEQRAEAHGLAPLTARIRRTLRKAGVRRSAARAANEAALTRREREVLRLVAEGLTSREIALNLGLGRSTIESLVRSAMVKLDAKTRVQAATLARDL
jgi:DNA-binding NarL/FixJ family response regulator